MFGWLKKKLKDPEARSELDRLRGEVSEKISTLDRETSHLEQLMKNMLAERAKNGQPK